MKGMLNTFDQFAVDGTYFQYNDQLYHIYSCWENTYSAWPVNICITQLADPWAVVSNLTGRRMISVPNEPWEQVPYARAGRLVTNEGLEQLTSPKTGQNFVLYSAARVNSPFYCIGMLELHTDGCIFRQNTQTGVYGTGHASYITSLDGSRDYIVYRALTTPSPPCKYAALTGGFANVGSEYLLNGKNAAAYLERGRNAELPSCW
ncbi:hypothetical protein BDZ45DRAFT_745151 [Acephala macrosclerotiorum]|nr:hypothetical protein BDZ45DRAFT_745151 [Acephala macrosclerotiorum]